MDFSIILPAYNEAENLAPLLRDLKKELDEFGIRYEIIVADDGSTDNTQEVLSVLKKEIQELKSLRIWPNIGFSGAVIRGLAVSRGEILGFMDADGQIEVKYLIQTYLKLKEENLDICKGKRIKRKDGFSRRLLSKIYNLLFKIMFGGNLDDIGGKPKVFTRSFYEDVKLESKGWFIDNEIMIKSIKRKYRIGEIPLIFLPRKKGKSKVRFSTTYEYLKNMLYWRFFKKL